METQENLKTDYFRSISYMFFSIWILLTSGVVNLLLPEIVKGSPTLAIQIYSLATALCAVYFMTIGLWGLLDGN